METRKRLAFVFKTACLLALAAGCARLETSSTEQTSLPTGSSSGYPGPESEPEAPPYPVDDAGSTAFDANLTPIAPAPEYSAETGALSIRLLYVDTSKPVRGQLFFAAEMLPVQGIEDGYVPKVGQYEDPSGSSDSEGSLNISHIPPGKYALALMTPLGPILVEHGESGEVIVFDVAAEQITDLGTAHVKLDPDFLEP